MKKGFSSISELRQEIYRLKIGKKECEAELGKKFSSPLTTISTVIGVFKGKHSGHEKSGLDGLLTQDLVTTISRVVLPFIVNTLFFRKSGFITKAIAGFISQKAAKNVNTNVLTEMVDKVKDLFAGKKKAKNRLATDYGIPPDSETY